MIVGIDFSLTSTGVSLIQDGKVELLAVNSKPLPEWWEHPERVQGIGRRVSDWVAERGPAPRWAIESPSFMSRGRGHDNVLTGWWLFVDYLIRDSGWEPPIRVTPAQVKKFATNNGSAGKVEVALAIARRYPDVPVTRDDEADALVVAAIAAAAHGEPFAGGLTKYQQEVVDKVLDGWKE